MTDVTVLANDLGRRIHGARSPSRSAEGDGRRCLRLVAWRLGAGAPLVLAGTAKLAGPQNWVIALHERAPWLGVSVETVAPGIAGAEVIIGLLAVVALLPKLVYPLVTLVALAFLVVAIVDLTASGRAACACFGSFTIMNHAASRVACSVVLVLSAQRCVSLLKGSPCAPS